MGEGKPEEANKLLAQRHTVATKYQSCDLNLSQSNSKAFGFPIISMCLTEN